MKTLVLCFAFFVFLFMITSSPALAGKPYFFINKAAMGSSDLRITGPLNGEGIAGHLSEKITALYFEDLTIRNFPEPVGASLFLFGASALMFGQYRKRKKNSG